ncbi:Hypothetical predicted protein [Mytilus galloprovincialis]|uniref:Uncharacterized protein n=1 Tax=Mytilus galloprovincialis TaxID=29158 RepID=A0A8B6D0B3_MYTGA|nr:Hypothetical predicted protein [Mytilus galloprovincialis]
MGIFGDSKPTTIAGFILAIISFVLQLTSFATPYWMHIKMGTVDSHFGLWQMCLSTTSGTTECAQIECEKFGCPSFKGTQALETLAFIILLAAVILVAIQLFVMKDKDILKKAGAVCCIVAGAFALIGVIVYATQKGVQTSNLHFSFAFCIIAAVGGIVSGVLLIIG